MSNTINGTPRPIQAVEGRGQTQSEKAKTAEGSEDHRKMASAGSGSTDHVDLTSTAQKLIELENGMKDVPVVDQQKVDSIKHAIADGSYNVNAESIASKLIEIEKSDN